MQTPYKILNIKPTASDSEIKQAYLQQVKNNPPEHNQQQFQLIHDAYTSIKDEKSRLSYELFTLPSADFNNVIDTALKTEQTIMINSTFLSKILAISLDKQLLNTIASPEKQ